VRLAIIENCHHAPSNARITKTAIDSSKFITSL
jgi:hypothetical protein